MIKNIFKEKEKNDFGYARSIKNRPQSSQSHRPQ